MSAPPAMLSSIKRSNSTVRATNDHALRFANSMEAAMRSPRSPARRRANGSWKTASGRSLSIAR